jgi:predicted XRE-type DNA-binding protein
MNIGTRKTHDNKPDAAVGTSEATTGVTLVSLIAKVDAPSVSSRRHGARARVDMKAATTSTANKFQEWFGAPNASKALIAPPFLNKRQKIDPALGVMKTKIKGESPEMKIVHGSGNVFRDLGFADAHVLSLRSKLLMSLGEFSQKNRARRVATERARLKAIIQGDPGRLTLDRLVKAATRIGIRVELLIDTTQGCDVPPSNHLHRAEPRKRG